MLEATKVTPVFLPADKEDSWLLLPSLVALLSGGTVQLEHTYSCILKVKGQIWGSKTEISININHSYYPLWSPKSTLTNLMIQIQF